MYTLASMDKGVQCMQFHTLGTVTLGGADYKACHTNTYVLDLRLEVSVSDVLPAQATSDCGKGKGCKCGGRGDGSLCGEQSPFAPFCKPGSDEPPGICRAKCQIDDVRPYQPAFSESQRADEERGGEKEQKGERKEEPRGKSEVVEGDGRGGAGFQ